MENGYTADSKDSFLLGCGFEELEEVCHTQVLVVALAVVELPFKLAYAEYIANEIVPDCRNFPTLLSTNRGTVCRS